MGVPRPDAGEVGDQAAELMEQLERRAATSSADSDPYKVAIIATRTRGDEFTVIYRQARSPQLLGYRGNAADYSALFEPRQTASQLAAVLLQSMSEPTAPGRRGLEQWGAGLVPDPSELRWISG